MRLVVPEPSALDAEADEDLLLAIGAGDATERELAAKAFFRRYVRPLYAYALRTYRHTLGEDGASDLVLQTLRRAFDRADTYDREGISDPAHSRARTTRWLTRIADRLFKDWLKSTSESTPLRLQHVGSGSTYGALHGDAVDLDEAHLQSDPDAEAQDDSDPLLRSDEGLQLRAALDRLSQRDREILLLSMRYDVPGRQLQIDESELDALCKRWGTTRENVRAIRRRALKKVREWCACHAPS